MNANALLAAIDAGTAPAILDVRSRMEFVQGHVPGAVHIPFWTLPARRSAISVSPDDPLVVYCGHGPRAWMAGAVLRARGFRQVVYLEGHMSRWTQAGLRQEVGSVRLSPGRAILSGTLVVGALDLTDALVFFGLRGVRPIRIFHGIAAGLLGRSAFQGGLATALLGVALHFFIALAIVSVFYLASTRVRALTRHPVLSGILYGVAAYAVMNLVVLPLSAAGRPTLPMPVLVNGLLIHAFGVGLPSALFARAAGRERSS